MDLNKIIEYIYKKINKRKKIMEDQAKEKAIKEANELWENQLKNDFSNHINKCLMETLNSLNKELNNFDESMKNHIQTLDKDFEKKFEAQISQIKEQCNNNHN